MKAFLPRDDGLWRMTRVGLISDIHGLLRPGILFASPSRAVVLACQGLAT